jgi:peptidyl-tRNA hydrolase
MKLVVKTDIDIVLEGKIFVQTKAGLISLPKDPRSRKTEIDKWQKLLRIYRENGAQKIICAFGDEVDEQLVTELQKLGAEVMRIPYKGP